MGIHNEEQNKKLIKIGMLKLTRNILIGILSVGWVVPIRGGIKGLALWLYSSHQPNYHESGDSGFNLQMSTGLLNIGLIWLALVIGFWAFVLANKLWPIRGKKSEETT
jgi:hypothetical protein